MQVRFLTEAQLRKQMESEFRTQAHRNDPTVPLKDVDMTRFWSAAYQERWVAKRVEEHRQRGWLVTAQQLKDLQVHRHFKVGDRARYVGPTRTESKAGYPDYERPYGQEGGIVEVVERRAGERLVTFRPDAPAIQVEGVLYELQALESQRFLERVPAPAPVRDQRTET